MRRFITLLFAITLLIPSSASAAAPVVTLESQAWWRLAGINIPTFVGAHVHVQATVPSDWTPTNGIVAVPVRVTLHEQTGKATILRVSDGSTVKQTWTINLSPCTNCVWEGTVNVDFSTWTTGRREMRWTANVPTNAEGKRQYQTTGWQVCVRSCTPSYRSGEFIEARGWYTDRGYQNARITSLLSTVRAGGVVKVKLAPGAGGKPTTLSAVYLDPDFHNGLTGSVLFKLTGPYIGNVTIPAGLSAGSHHLVLLASDGLNVGVLSVPFVVKG